EDLAQLPVGHYGVEAGYHFAINSYYFLCADLAILQQARFRELAARAQVLERLDAQAQAVQEAYMAVVRARESFNARGGALLHPEVIEAWLAGAYEVCAVCGTADTVWCSACRTTLCLAHAVLYDDPDGETLHVYCPTHPTGEWDGFDGEDDDEASEEADC